MGVVTLTAYWHIVRVLLRQRKKQGKLFFFVFFLWLCLHMGGEQVIVVVNVCGAV